MSEELPEKYESNPVGCLQERIQKAGKNPPEYVAKHELGKSHSKEFVFQVLLDDGLKAEGSGPTKKIAKHNAARNMIDVLDGRAKAITEDVSMSIDVGLKALRGGDSSTSSSSARDKGSSRTSVKIEKDNIKEPRKEKDNSVYPYNSFKPSVPKSNHSIEQNRGLNDDDDQLVKIKIKKEVKTEGKWILDLVMDKVFKQIEKNERIKDPQPEQICKLCNLVFYDEKFCKSHKKGENHDLVHRGQFPGKGGFNCFLCWVNFLQPESLLNHLARPNHHDKAKKYGVLKIWMEPQPIVPTWDTMNLFKDLRDLKDEEDNFSRRRGRSRSRDRIRIHMSPDRQRVRGRSPDQAIKSGVAGDWRKAREKTTVEIERTKERERREQEERERIARKRREQRDRERRERERWEMEERQRREDQRRRWEDEERYWQQREEQEWREWQRRKREEEERWEREWTLREEREWMEQKGREWRERERRQDSSRSLERRSSSRKGDFRMGSSSRDAGFAGQGVERELEGLWEGSRPKVKKRKHHKRDLEDGECVSDEEMIEQRPRKHKKSDRSKERDVKIENDKILKHKKSGKSEKSRKHEKSIKSEHSRKSEKSRKHEKSRDLEKSRKTIKMEDSRKVDKYRLLEKKLDKKSRASASTSKSSGKSSKSNLDLRELLKKKRALQKLEEEVSSDENDSDDASDDNSGSEDESSSSSDSSSSSGSSSKGGKKRKYVKTKKRGATNLLVEMKGAILGVLDKEISSLARK